MRTLFLSVLTALIGSAVVPAAASTRADERCEARGSRTVEANPRIRVYKLGERFIGCAQRTGRRMTLGTEFECTGGGGGGTCDGVLLEAVAGRFVVLSTLGAGPAHTSGPSDGAVWVVDVVRRRTTFSWSTQGAMRQHDDGYVTDAAVTPGGRVAFVAELRNRFSEGPPIHRQVRLVGPGGHVVADEGADIEEGSLAISRSRAYWLHAGGPRSALLP